MKKSAIAIALFFLFVGYSAYADEIGPDTARVEKHATVTESPEALALPSPEAVLEEVSEDLSEGEEEFYQDIETYHEETFEIEGTVYEMADVKSEGSFVVYDGEGNIVQSGDGEYEGGSLLMTEGSTSYYIVD